MNKIVYSPESKKDLDEIYDYIHDNLKNFLAAKNAISGIMKKISELKEYPQLGPAWYLQNDMNSGFRVLYHKNYIIFYTVKKEDICIVSIIHQRQNYVQQLFY